MRLIDADALIKVIQQNDYMLTAKHNSMAPGMFTSGIRQAVDESQIIDPVKHGRWIPNQHWQYENGNMTMSGDTGIGCSVCGKVNFTGINQRTHYCPNCGARMDGEL